MAKRIESVDGVKVSVQQRAYGPHPHPQHRGKQVPYTNVLHLILDDETELFACEVCGGTFEKITQAAAHLSKHSEKHGMPDTPIKLIQMVLGHVKLAQSNDSTSPYQDAADALNARRIKTVRGFKWTGQNVRQMYSLYEKQYTARLPRVPRQQRRRVVAVPTQDTVAASQSVRTPHTALDTVGDNNDVISVLRNNQLLEMLDDIESSVTAVDGSWAKIEQGVVKISLLLSQIRQIALAVQSENTTDTTLQEKADAYDRLIKKLDQFGMTIEH